MNAITQSELDNLILAARSPNGPASIEWFWSQREALIAAAEDGLKAEGEIKRITFCRDNAVSMEKRASEESEALRDRVQELEEALNEADTWICELLPASSNGGDRLEQLRSALSNPTPQPPRYTLDGWQDIETAPKDGTWIIIGHPEWRRSADGYWSDDFREWRFSGYAPERQPTHWQPLPPAPQQKEEA
jgi:hypothetical protein